VLGLNDTELENTVCEVDIDEAREEGDEVSELEVVDVGEDIEEEQKDFEELGDWKLWRLAVRNRQRRGGETTKGWSRCS